MKEVMKKRFAKPCAVILSLSLGLTGWGDISSAKKKAEPHLDSSKVRIDLSKKAKRTIHIKGIKKKNVKSLTVKSDRNKTAKPKLKDESKTSFVVKGKKAGKATITVTLTTRKKINKKTQFVMELAVTVVDSSKSPEKTDKPGQTDQPTAGTPLPTGPVVTGAPSGIPSVTPAPAGTPTAAPTATVAATQNPANTSDPSGGGSSGESGGGSGGSSGGSGGSGGGGRTPTKSPIRTLAPTNAPTVAPIVPTRSPSAPTVAPATPTPITEPVNLRTRANDTLLAKDEYYDPYIEYGAAFLDRQMELYLSDKEDKAKVTVTDTAEYRTKSIAESQYGSDEEFRNSYNAGEVEVRGDRTEKSMFTFTLPASRCFKPDWVDGIKMQRTIMNNTEDRFSNAYKNAENILSAYGSYLLSYAISNYENLGILSNYDVYCSYDEGTDTFILKAFSGAKKENIKTVTNMFKTILNKLKRQADGTNITTEVDKALFAHEQTALLGEVVYTDGDSDESFAKHVDSSPAVLMFNGRGTGFAYASMFNLLSRKLGVLSRIVEKDDSGNRLAWNLVKVDGMWQVVDSAADDDSSIRYYADGLSSSDLIYPTHFARDKQTKAFFLLNREQTRRTDKLIYGGSSTLHDSLDASGSSIIYREVYGPINICSGGHSIIYASNHGTESEIEDRELKLRMALYHPCYRSFDGYARLFFIANSMGAEDDPSPADEGLDYTWLSPTRLFYLSSATTFAYERSCPTLFFTYPNHRMSQVYFLDKDTFNAYEMMLPFYKAMPLVTDSEGREQALESCRVLEHRADAPSEFESYSIVTYYDDVNNKLLCFEATEESKDNRGHKIYVSDLTDYKLGQIDTERFEDEGYSYILSLLEEAMSAIEPVDMDYSNALDNSSIKGMYSNVWGVFVSVAYDNMNHTADGWLPLMKSNEYEQVFTGNGGNNKEAFELRNGYWMA